LLEIAVFILVGGQIGVAATLGLTLVTAIAGAVLLRRQGLATLARIRAELEANRIPARQLADGAMIAVAGLMLLTPGFVSDLAGLLLFVPALRDAAWRQAAKRFKLQVVRRPGGGRPSGPVVELDDAEFASRPNPSTPWRSPPRRP
ncbi:MAG TPA: FxsA family protein, partial [Afifellaceae bacterium]|nr:FxsA family protein [Afifellaceae bacterium]